MIEYLEGAGPDEPRALVFSEHGWGWWEVGPASTDTIVVTDIRMAYRLGLEAYRHGRAFAHVPVPANVQLDFPFIQAMQICGLDPRTTNVLLTMPAGLANEVVHGRRQALLSREVTGEIIERTGAELVLLTCERTGFIYDGKLVHPRYNLKGTRTERYTIEPGTFNFMGIKSEKRGLLKARPGRSLIVLDFNAIDGRSIVSLHPDSPKNLRWCQGDFYAMMFQELFGKHPDHDERQALKLAFTRYCYRTSVSKVPPELDALFSEKMPWIEELRKQNHDPDFHDHEGHGLALKAQTKSSRTFNGALFEAVGLLCTDDRSYDPLFTVHDELVVEVDDDKVGLAADLASTLEVGAYETSGVMHVVRFKVGKDYAQCK